MVEVPEVADGQHKNTGVSDTVGGSERSLALTQVAFDGYRIKMNKILLRDQLTTTRRQQGMIGEDRDGRHDRTRIASTLLNDTFSIPLGLLSSSCSTHAKGKIQHEQVRTKRTK